MKKQLQVIGYGRTAEILAYGNDHVLKLFRSELPISSVEEEYRYSSIVYHSGLTVPEPVQIIDYDGRKGIIYQKIRGQTVLSNLAAKPWTVHQQGAACPQNRALYPGCRPQYHE